MVEKKKLGWVWILMVVLLVIIALASIYQVWRFATYRMSAEVDCEIKQMDYRWVTNGTCSIELASAGDNTLCALPKDFHCKGSLRDFPLIRALVEAANEG